MAAAMRRSVSSAPFLRRLLLSGHSSPLLEGHPSGTILCKANYTTGQFSLFPGSPKFFQNHSFHKSLLTEVRSFSNVAPIKSTESIGKITIGPEGGNSTEKETGFLYYGPISSTIKKVKLLSLSTCCLSVSLGPVVTFMTSPDMNVILKGAVASTVILLSASTTAALHWFVSPYIHRLRWQPGSDSFEVEMMSWLATYIPRTIRFVDIRPAETNRPFVTFKASDSFYFIDVEHCDNKALLQKLMVKSRPSALKNT